MHVINAVNYHYKTKETLLILVHNFMERTV